MPSSLRPWSMTIAEKREDWPLILRSSPSVTTTSQTKSSKVESPELSSFKASAWTSALNFSFADRAAEADTMITMPTIHALYATMIWTPSGSSMEPTTMATLAQKKNMFQKITSHTLWYLVLATYRKRNVALSVTIPPMRLVTWTLITREMTMIMAYNKGGAFRSARFQHVVAPVKNANAAKHENVWPSVIHRGWWRTTLMTIVSDARPTPANTNQHENSKSRTIFASMRRLTCSSSTLGAVRWRQMQRTSAQMRRSCDLPHGTMDKAPRARLIQNKTQPMNRIAISSPAKVRLPRSIAADEFG
mmetsp:Transcript_103670/g.290344  ORF Transcript_103670/g.290344 Transcript_103670/m.290344 type:complete len:304 (+) Transcript_103670:650-1561(+)